MSASASRKGKTIGDPMTKKIIPNPKYQHVQSTIDTGASMNKYLRKIEEIKQNYRFGKDEIFKRLKVTTFVQLLIQVHRLNNDDDFDIPLSAASDGRPETADREVYRIVNGSPTNSIALTESDFGRNNEQESSRSTLLSVARGVGELDMNVPAAASKSVTNVNDLGPYLILDIREQDDFEQFHLISAVSYPKAILSRSMMYESKEMLSYRNREGKVILLYDNDERSAPTAATTLVQRGYDNVFMLSGGIKLALKIFPEGLFTGTPPLEVTGVKPKTMKPANQKQFSNEDINKLEIYLDNALQDKSIGTSSRLSKASGSGMNSRMSSSRSTAMSSSRVTSSMISDRPHFKP